MSTPFDDMVERDNAYVKTTKRLYLNALRSGKQIPDFDEIHKILRRFAHNSEGKGMSKKGARAWASLQLLDIRRAMDKKLTETRPNDIIK